ncbi:MAG TPA: methionine--tRNA ligase subunit beta [Chloroflexota bacterium]|nr:methionine--tRNA ligase subunit beta [Chloroflexota bacterium]
MESSSAPRADAQAKATGLISIDTFAQIDLRVGQVVRAERVPNADKLLRLEVDLAEPEPRQLLAGVAEWYAPEGLVGQKILVVANLQPRRMRGLESRGMLLAASADDGRPLLATVPPETPNGSRLR